MPAVSQNEKNTVDAPRDGHELAAARVICSNARRVLRDILAHVADGARDLRVGLTWSRDLERFEQVSMEQARLLARFPISTTDARFGALVHRARASFVAFRETVRRDIIGAIDSRTDDAACDAAMRKVAGRSVLADRSLESIERAVAQYCAPFSAALQHKESDEHLVAEMRR